MLSRSLRSIWVLLCCVFFLASCSSTSFVYNRLDFLLSRYVNGYADLNSEQDDFFEERLDPLLDWHRRNELPCYISLIEDFETALDGPIQSQDIAAATGDFEIAWYRLQDELVDLLLELGAQLSDEQVQEFLARLQEDQEELYEDYVERSEEEFREDTYDNTLDTAGDYLGRLSKEQRELVQTASDKLQRADALMYAERERFNNALRLEMARESGWEERVLALVAQQSENPAQEYVAVLEHNFAIMHELTADLLNSRSEKQDRHLRNKIGTLRDELQELVAQAEQPTSCAVAAIAQPSPVQS